jgi:hypothetical protein
MAWLNVEFAKAREIKPAQFVLHYLDRDMGRLYPLKLPAIKSRSYQDSC